MKQFIAVMKALSDPNRIKIMKILEVKEFCVCEITGILGLAQSTVSKHLKILADAGLVDSCKDGAWVNYKLAENPESHYAAVMQNNLKGWLNSDHQIKNILSRSDKVDRISICEAKEVLRIMNG